MKEVRFFYVPDAGGQTALPEEEAQHACRVLRLRAGDEVFLMDGAGSFYRAELSIVSQKHCMYNILEMLPQPKAWHGEMRLAIAPTKNIDRIEWMAEKCTEIGWDSLTFLDCRFSERRQVRKDRIEKIVVSAAKQSRKPFMPEVEGMTDFSEFVARPIEGRKFICHCYGEVKRRDLFDELKASPEKTPVTVMVGPEGDFSIDEVRLAMEHGFESVTLGDFRLRTETAGLMAVTIFQLANRRTDI